MASKGFRSLRWKSGENHSTISRCWASLPWVANG